MSNDKGAVRKYKGINSVPSEGVWLTAGNYTVEAWAGDSVSASFDDKYYKGMERVEITSGSTQQVEVVCKIANVVASVNYGEAVDEVLKDYTMTVSHDRGELVFEGHDDRKGYFMMPSTDTNLTWVLAGTDNLGHTFNRTGVINNVKPGYEYRINVKHEGTVDEVGGAFLTIEIDETTNDIEDEILISSAPDIKGYDFDIAQGLSGEKGTIGRRTVWVLSSTKLKSVVMKSDLLAMLLNDQSERDCDFISMTEEYKNALSAKGITANYIEDAVSGSSKMKIVLDESMTNALENGEYVITFEATDVTGKKRVETLKISVSDAPVQTLAPDLTPSNLRATSMTVTAKVVKENAANAGIEYRQASSRTGDWTRAEATIAGGIITAKLTGLAPDTKYEYRAVCDGFVSNDVQSFTTEAAPQIPNGGFEDWFMDGKIQRLYAQGGQMFWDSGNVGSATIGQNLTVPESNIKHGGNYSAKLESKKVVIAFAAGNCFVGEFLGTENTTKGILGWGREFKGRPKALHGWVKYTPAKIDNVASGTPAECVKGNLDRGTIYVALLSNTTCADATYGQSWPVVVRTKGPTLFDKNDAGVVAYGEKVFTEATAGDGLIEFTIPLDYRTDNVLPQRLVLTCSASYWGDYYSGGAGSVMYIDDFEFIYE